MKTLRNKVLDTTFDLCKKGSSVEGSADHMARLMGVTGMFMHIDKHGRRLKFVNAKAYRRWQRQQDQAYVPTLAEDLDAFATVTLGVGSTFEHTNVNLTRSRKGGKKLAGKKHSTRFSQRGGDHYNVETWHTNAHREARQAMDKRDTNAQAKAEQAFENKLG